MVLVSMIMLSIIPYTAYATQPYVAGYPDTSTYYKAWIYTNFQGSNPNQFSTVMLNELSIAEDLVQIELVGFINQEVRYK